MQDKILPPEGKNPTFMYPSKVVKEFEKLVRNKFDIYSSLFLNLPYRRESKIGIFIPMLYHHCHEGLASGRNPVEILDSFFLNYAKIETERDKIDFMFRVIQYVERQVVLYDSVEDAAFTNLQELGNDLSIKDFFQVPDSKKNSDHLIEKLSNFSARLVFTAHPTQFYPPAVLEIIHNLRSLIKTNQINEIDLTLQQLGLTSLINSQKPTPVDEAKNIIYFLEKVYYDAVGEIYTYIKEKVGNNDFNNPNIIKLGFWPGGDRDGNPFVTSEITMNVADELRMTLMKCYYTDVQGLQKKLTFREIENILHDLSERLYNLMFDPEKFIRYEEIIKPLDTIRGLLVNKYHGIYLKDLDHFIDKVNIFRTHFATLDIRQDHRIHKQVIEAVLKKERIISASLMELGKDELISI